MIRTNCKSWGEKSHNPRKPKALQNSDTRYPSSTVEERRGGEREKKHGGQEAESALPVTRVFRIIVNLCKK